MGSTFKELNSNRHCSSARGIGMKLRSILLATVLFSLSSLSNADQNAPELELLFDKLNDTSDSHSAQKLTSKIWQIWTYNDRDDINKLMHAGVTLMNARQYKGALAQFDRIIELEPTFAEGWNKRATLYFLMDRYDDSINDIRETLTREPRHFGAMSGLGVILTETGDHTDAIAAFEYALKVNPH